MKTNLLLKIITVLILLTVPGVNFAQAPDLGSAASFVFFTSSGAVGNTGVSQITGDIGTNNGAITGFEFATVIGTIHNADVVTAQCSLDLLAAYNQLFATSPTATHAPVLGDGETLFAGVYSLAAAGSVSATLTLDAQGDSNAVFIFQVGGAFTTSASATISLVNGASAKNVFWIAEGAIAMAASTTMKGTLIAHNGAISMAAGGSLHGRMFSTTGAVSMDGVSAMSASILPTCPIANYQVAPNLGSLSNFALFTTAGAIGNTGVSQLFGNIGSNSGAITGFDAPSTVNGTIYNNDAVTVQAITDLQAACFQLSAIPATNSTHTPVFGGGETLFAGVYAIGAAASVAGTLTLDAQGDPNAIFIFKIGGAFTTGASATVILLNGASACNVFWIADGAIAMATLTTMKGTLIAHPGAASMGAGCMLEGRLFSTTGAVSVYGVSASMPNGCSRATVWTGAAGTTDWFSPCNWTRGVPDANTEAFIPTELLAGRLYPVINSGIAAVDSVTIENAASLTVISSTLQVKGAMVNSGTMDAGSGSIEMTGASGQVIAANTFQNNALNHLIISNKSAAGITLGGAVDIYGSVTYSGTGMQLNTNDVLTFKSTASNSARLGDMTGNVITGKATIECYISARKAWRLLSIPVNTDQTIKQAWQEGATGTGSDPVPGYGTQITSDRQAWLAEGFDMYSSNGPSMKTYNVAGGGWTGVPGTNGSLIKTNSGYMTFIRGERTANLFNSTPTETVLRSFGTLYTGNQDTIVVDNANNEYACIGNPYASALDMRFISKSGMKDFFYVWDPNLGGSFGYGAFQTFSYDGSDYVVSPGMGSYPSAGSVSNYIHSGQAFLVQSMVGGGNIRFGEEAKADDNPLVSLVGGASHPRLLISLYGLKPGSDDYMIDGVLSNYGDEYSNTVDDMDARKLSNSSENLAIKSANILLAVERRQGVSVTDTLFLHLTNTKIQQYRFEIKGDQLGRPGLIGFVEDSYLHTSTAINLDGTTMLNFSIVNTPASYAHDRFRIVFSQAVILPVTFTSLKAFSRHNNINVEWKVENELNTRNYEVERSIDSRQFKPLATVAAKGNGDHYTTYLAEDILPVEGYNYYRIKAVDMDGKKATTNTIKVFMEKEKQEISIYPNPVTDGVIRLRFDNMLAGTYALTLFNNLGQEIFHKSIEHKETTGAAFITLNQQLIHGTYQLEIIKPGGNKIRMNVIY